MKIKSERDFWSGLVFLLAAIGFGVGALNHWTGSAAQPGPGYFPLLLSGLLAILGVAVLFKSLTIEAEGGDAIGAIAWRPLLAVVVALAVFGATLQRLGLIASVALLVVIAGLGAKESRWRGVLVERRAALPRLLARVRPRPARDAAALAARGMSAARPFRRRAHRSPQGEGTRMSAARPFRRRAHRSPQGEGTSVTGAPPSWT